MITNGQVPVLVSLELTVKLTSVVQLSVIDAFPVKASNAATVAAAAGASVASHPSIVLAVIVPVIVGTVVSFTVTVCEHVLTFPLLSLIEYTRVIISGQVLPSEVLLTKVKLAVSIPSLSVALPPAAINSAKLAYGVGTSEEHSTVIFAGQLITGPSVSVTVTVKVQVFTLLQPSVAV